MSSERERQRLEDIVANIEMIERYVADIPFETFRADDKAVNATERCLQRITEAVIKISPERMTAIAPGAPIKAVRSLATCFVTNMTTSILRRSTIPPPTICRC